MNYSYPRDPKLVLEMPSGLFIGHGVHFCPPSAHTFISRLPTIPRSLNDVSPGPLEQEEIPRTSRRRNAVLCGGVSRTRFSDCHCRSARARSPSSRRELALAFIEVNHLFERRWSYIQASEEFFLPPRNSNPLRSDQVDPSSRSFCNSSRTAQYRDSFGASLTFREINRQAVDPLLAVSPS